MKKTFYQKTKYNRPFIECRADPFVMRGVDGNYYFTASVPEYDRIVLRRGRTIDDLADTEEITVWRKHDYGEMSIHIWAPELHYIGDRWYLYFAAGKKEDCWNIRPYVLECSGADPMKDPWLECGRLKTADDFSFQDFSLDMTIFWHKEQLYCVWAEKVNTGKKISNLYLAKMSSPICLETEQILLSTPDYNWERVDFWVNEGPAVIKHDGRIYLTYSASSTGACYCMGLLSIEEDEDLLDPSKWKKSRNPVLESDFEKGLFGPGHNSFVKDEEGTGYIMFYHARQYDEIEGDPLYDGNRHTYRMKVAWDRNGAPLFDYKNNF